MYPAVWSFVSNYRYGWSEQQIGFSLGAFGLCGAIVMGLQPGRNAGRLQRRERSGRYRQGDGSGQEAEDGDTRRDRSQPHQLISPVDASSLLVNHPKAIIKGLAPIGETLLV